MPFESFWIAVILTGALGALLILFGMRRYSYAINPLFQFAIFDIGVLSLLSAIVANSLNDGQGGGLTATLHLVIIYLSGFFLVFLPRRFSLPSRLFDRLQYVAGKNVGSTGYSGISQWLLITLAFALFILLMWTSGAGVLWLTESRLAYQSYRAGSGFIYVMVQWALLVSLLYYLWTRKPQLAGLIMGICLYTCAAYFTGSKANIFSGFVVASIYYNFFVRRIRAMLVLFAPVAVLCAFITLLLLQGSYDEVFLAISYFRDYAETTGQFLERFDEFGLQWGYGTLSDFWFYVPRALYPDKPFEYGILLINKVLFPGAAEQGATPGVLPWALAYLDFGVVGVFISGVFTGFIRRGAYELFLSNRESVLAFVLMIQLSLMPVFAYATLPLILIIGIVLSLFFRKKIVFV
jgi:oligosaccharide repeat unit polymerase